MPSSSAIARSAKPVNNFDGGVRVWLGSSGRDEGVSPIIYAHLILMMKYKVPLDSSQDPLSAPREPPFSIEDRRLLKHRTYRRSFLWVLLYCPRRYYCFVHNRPHLFCCKPGYEHARKVKVSTRSRGKCDAVYQSTLQTHFPCLFSIYLRSTWTQREGKKKRKRPWNVPHSLLYINMSTSSICCIPLCSSATAFSLFTSQLCTASIDAAATTAVHHLTVIIYCRSVSSRSPSFFFFCFSSSRSLRSNFRFYRASRNNPFFLKWSVAETCSSGFQQCYWLRSLVPDLQRRNHWVTKSIEPDERV